MLLTLHNGGKYGTMHFMEVPGGQSQYKDCLKPRASRPTKSGGWGTGDTAPGPPNFFLEKGLHEAFYLYISGLYLHAVYFSFAFYCIVWTQ